MTPERFNQCLDALGWSSKELAALLDIDDRNVRRWASGKLDIPDKLAAWLEDVGKYMEDHPPPDKPVWAPGLKNYFECAGCGMTFRRGEDYGPQQIVDGEWCNECCLGERWVSLAKE